MIHFDAKHQKSEAKTKVKEAKIKWKNCSETKSKQKKVKKAKKWKNILEFRFTLFRFEAKITKSKRSEKFKANKSEKKRKEAKKEKWNFIVK